MSYACSTLDEKLGKDSVDHEIDLKLNLDIQNLSKYNKWDERYTQGKEVQVGDF